MFVCIKFKSQWLGRVITIQIKSISNRTTVRVNELHHWTMGMSCFSGNDSATMPIVIFLVIELIFGLNTLFRFIRKNKRCDYSEHSLSFVCLFVLSYGVLLATHTHMIHLKMGLCEQNRTELYLFYTFTAKICRAALMELHTNCGVCCRFFHVCKSKTGRAETLKK